MDKGPALRRLTYNMDVVNTQMRYSVLQAKKRAKW